MASAVLSQSKLNVYEAITQKIVAMIEVGVDTYKTPWHTGGAAIMLPTNAATHAEYRGINVVALWAEAMYRSYATGLWASYKQWQSLGAQVRKGESGALIVFYKRAELAPADPEDEAATELRFFARASWVFNIAQVDGYQTPTPEARSAIERITEAEAFVSATRATVAHGYAMACYRRKLDLIEMPHAECFVGSSTSSPTESYYATLLHELTHWSGAEHRLNRQFGKRYGDEAYGVEELVAELGAAFMCAAFGIALEPRPDHAAYVASWLKVLNRDNRAIFTAASKAQEAFEHLAYLATNNEGPPGG
jgi:antirestriction protein ArdC